MAWTGEFDQAGRWLQRTALALQTDAGPDIRLLLHQTTGMLKAALGLNRKALEEFSAAEYLQSQLEDLPAIAGQVTGWLLATRARLGMTGQASAALAALSDERAGAGELGNARAVICLAEGDPAGALSAVRDVLDGTAPVIGYATVVEAYLLAGLAHRELGDQRAANQAAERALADRLSRQCVHANRSRHCARASGLDRRLASRGISFVAVRPRMSARSPSVSSGVASMSARQETARSCGR
jgi:LuxR family transcriptional regulator, maltose regulon positive regulatory protein